MTWRCATHADTGAALIAAMLALALVSAIVAGMAVIASMEPVIAANSEGAAAALYVADAGFEIAAAELTDVSDWSAVLSGAVRSAILAGTGSTLHLPDGRSIDLARHTNVINCGRASGCSDGQLDQPTAERPWGRNNPRWRVYGHATTANLWDRGGRLPPFVVVVWVGDDPAEQDDAPLVDSAAEEGTPLAGSGIMGVRTESFGTRGAHAVRMGTMLRVAGGSGVRIVNRASGR